MVRLLTIPSRTTMDESFQMLLLLLRHENASPTLNKDIQGSPSLIAGLTPSGPRSLTQPSLLKVHHEMSLSVYKAG